MINPGTSFKISLALLLMSLSLLTLGCAARRVSLAENHGIRVEKIDHDRVEFRDIDLLKDGDKAVVRGVAERSGVAVPPLGHVDVEIIDSKGRQQLLAATWLTPRRIPRRRGGNSTFSLKLPSVPSPGSTVLVRYHPSLSIPDEEKPDW